MRRICNTTITSLSAWVFSGIAALAILGACATDDTGPKDTTMDYWSKKKGDCEEVLSLIKEGKIDTTPLITHRFPLCEIEEAYRVFENKLDGVIKVAIF